MPVVFFKKDFNLAIVFALILSFLISSCVDTQQTATPDISTEVALSPTSTLTAILLPTNEPEQEQPEDGMHYSEASSPGPETVPEGTFQQMKNNKCTECHKTVPQTHMERGIIVTQQECQTCHLNLDQIHVTVNTPEEQ